MKKFEEQAITKIAKTLIKGGLAAKECYCGPQPEEGKMQPSPIVVKG